MRSKLKECTLTVQVADIFKRLQQVGDLERMRKVVNRIDEDLFELEQEAAKNAVSENDSDDVSPSGMSVSVSDSDTQPTASKSSKSSKTGKSTKKDATGNSAESESD
ncbi:hypothetical protein [Spirulina subsalsa]|uniref:hypothetical protein n=1 Tax=Spirulina subsalsa TaxID=54311 RepID=UPI000304229E|nr:hypothetical protein [Spirulina subsalsa]